MSRRQPSARLQSQKDKVAVAAEETEDEDGTKLTEYVDASSIDVFGQEEDPDEEDQEGGDEEDQVNEGSQEDEGDEENEAAVPVAAGKSESGKGKRKAAMTTSKAGASSKAQRLGLQLTRVWMTRVNVMIPPSLS